MSQALLQKVAPKTKQFSFFSFFSVFLYSFLIHTHTHAQMSMDTPPFDPSDYSYVIGIGNL